jgi:hypothetical protein
MTLPPGKYRPEEAAADIAAGAQRERAGYQALLDRVAAIEAVLFPQWTDERVAEFRRRWDEQMQAGEHEEIEWLPPGPSVIRDMLSGCVTVIRPGETLAVRARSDWTAHQVAELQRYANAVTTGEPYGFAVLFLPGDEFAVVTKEQPGSGTRNCRCSVVPD